MNLNPLRSLVCIGALVAQTSIVPASAEQSKPRSPKSFATGTYRNLFKEIGKSDREITDKLNQAWGQLFYGNDANERVFFPAGKNMAYIKDVGNNDVRSEGMSYGMMIAVQMDKKDEFDRLWRWAKTHMQYQSGPWKGYFAWQCDEKGKIKGTTPASDGEEYIVTALFFAAGRWGSGAGILNYRAEADAILHQMVHKEAENGGDVSVAKNMFNAKEHQVVFVPNGDAATFTDPSYHLPAFYELWAKWTKKDRNFWTQAASTSRAFFHKSSHPTTGLNPDYAKFDGTPTTAPWDPKSNTNDFRFDAFRVAQNIAVDYAWFGVDPWQVEQSNRLLDFFAKQKPGYVSNYTLAGKPLVTFRSTGLVAMNATAGLAATTPHARAFVSDLWNAAVPSGQWRYYDGLLYMLGLLHSSGHYRIYAPRSN